MKRRQAVGAVPEINRPRIRRNLHVRYRKGSLNNLPPTLQPHLTNYNTVEQAREAKFKAAQEKAKREGVNSLTREDIDGLTPEQLKELRGY